MLYDAFLFSCLFILAKNHTHCSSLLAKHTIPGPSCTCFGIVQFRAQHHWASVSEPPLTCRYALSTYIYMCSCIYIYTYVHIYICLKPPHTRFKHPHTSVGFRIPILPNLLQVTPMADRRERRREQQRARRARESSPRRRCRLAQQRVRQSLLRALKTSLQRASETSLQRASETSLQRASETSVLRASETESQRAK